MQTNEQFRPEWASAPGETIADILRERQISLKEFARSMDEPPEHLTDLLEGRATITLGLARKLERVRVQDVAYFRIAPRRGSCMVTSLGPPPTRAGTGLLERTIGRSPGRARTRSGRGHRTTTAKYR